MRSYFYSRNIVVLHTKLETHALLLELLLRLFGLQNHILVIVDIQSFEGVLVSSCIGLLVWSW